MDDAITLYSYQPTGGFYHTDRPHIPENAMADGSKNIFVQGRNAMRTFRGLKESGVGGRTMCKVSGGYASLNDTDDVLGIGSVFNYIANSLFWIGEGSVLLNGEALVDEVTEEPFIATSNLQLSPSPYEQAFTAGLAQPDAPIVEARTPTLLDPTAGLMTGVFSFKIARVRSLTGGRSIASVTSAVVPFSGQAARLTFPLADSNGQDRWAVFATKAGFGGTGVHYLVQEIDDDDLVEIDGIERSYEFNIVDADLLPVTAYIDDYPPPAGSFAGRIENYIVVIGAYNNAIAASIRNFPESFHPEHLAFLPKAPTAVLQDQLGSYIYIACEDSVHALSVAPTAFGNPLILQTIWSDTGIANSHNWCSVEGTVYAFVSRQGAVTMDRDGRPSTEFALPVTKLMSGWEVDATTVFHVPDLNSVIYCNGGVAVAFNYQNLTWSAPAMMSEFATGSAVSGVVIDRRLKITLLNDDEFTLYDFDEKPTPTSTTAFKIVSPDRTFANRFNLLGLQATFNAPNVGTFTTKAVVDYNGREKSIQTVVTEVGMNDTVKSRWYVPRADAVRIEYSGTQSDFDEDSYLSFVDLFATIDESARLTA